MTTYNSEIVKNTILHVFQEEKRSMSKKELVKKTKFPNRVVKDAIHDLTKEGYLTKNGIGYSLIKSPTNLTAPHLAQETNAEIRKDILSLFKELQETDPVIHRNSIFALLRDKYPAAKIKSSIQVLLNSSKQLKTVSRGAYSLNTTPIPEVLSVPQVASHIKKVLGTRTLAYKEIAQVMDKNCSSMQIQEALKALRKKGEIINVKPGKGRPGVYRLASSDVAPTEPREVSPLKAIAEKKEKILEEKEVSALEALQKSRSFVRLQTGYKKFDGDYSLVIKIGAAIINKLGWKHKDNLMMRWLFEEKRIRLCKASEGYNLFEGDGGTFEMVIPLPELSGYNFPKPITNTAKGGKNLNINISLDQVKDQAGELIIHLKDTVDIDYV